jgi:hypothetical protein
MANPDHSLASALDSRRCRGYLGWTRRSLGTPIIAFAVGISLSACATAPLSPYTSDTTPLILAPASLAGVKDKRGRFREIFCEILETRGETLPDYRPCEQALTRVGTEPSGTGREVGLGRSARPLVAVVVPGVGWDCFSNWLAPRGTVPAHLRLVGYDRAVIKVDSLSGSASNARQIRDAIMDMQPDDAEPRLVLIGYSKGAADILEALVSYPEIRSRIAAVVSAAGSVGGSPLGNQLDPSQLALLRHWPGADCAPGDGGAVESLRPAKRQAWLAQNALPADLPYYSLVTFPQPERISVILKLTYNKLSRIDARNDGQLLFYDQVIPGSTLLGYVNADHWALAVPIGRTHPFLRRTFVNHNDFPREALIEAVLRFIEEDLETSGNRFR